VKVNNNFAGKNKIDESFFYANRSRIQGELTEVPDVLLDSFGLAPAAVGLDQSLVLLRSGHRILDH
jgi:hypothetical protein